MWFNRVEYGRSAAWFLGASIFLAGCGGSGELDPVGEPTTPAPVETADDALLAPPADASGLGPLPTTSAEYQLPASIDPAVLSGRATEVWARVWRPATLAAGPYPIILIMHGNTITCGATPQVTSSALGDCNYTTTGTCTGAYPVVLPHHLGYGYLAQRLASWGYFVVSLNTNRGITCGAGVSGDSGLNLARGRMFLKHLSLLYQWSTQAGTTPASLGVDLQGWLDFSGIGFIGHSRGGEGARAAVAQYNDVGSPWPALIPGAGFRSILEIGGNDGQTSRVLNAVGLYWHQLQPACDASNRQFPGLKPFDRMLSQAGDSTSRSKSYSIVWNQNHSMYNSYWTGSDALGCSGTYWTETPEFPQLGDSVQMRTTARQIVGAFFRGSMPNAVLGAYDPTLLQTFDPAYGMPASVRAVTNINRGYVASGSPTVQAALDDMTSQGLSTFNGVTAVYGPVPDADASLRAVGLAWSGASSAKFFQSAWAATGSGVDLSGDAALDFRIARRADPLNVKDVPTNIVIQLVGANNALSSAVQLSTYTTLGGPTGTVYSNAGVPTSYYHPALRTVSIPLCDFTGVSLSAIRGVRFTFSSTATGAVYLTNIHRRVGGGAACTPTPAVLPGQSSPGIDVSVPSPESLGEGASPVVLTEGNEILDAHGLDGDVPGLGRGAEVTVRGAEPFPVSQELAALELGDELVTLSRYPDPTRLDVLTFTLSEQQVRRLSGAPRAAVRHGTSGPSPVRWELGALDTARLRAPH